MQGFFILGKDRNNFVIKNISLALMTVFYFVAGLNHFWHPGDYLRIMPPYLPYPSLLVQISGLAESFLAVLLPWPKTRRWACYGIIALLIAIFPANIYMLTSGGAGTTFPHWALVARLPLQGVLILWAYWHSLPNKYRK
jgi:uncharacterized membrane protein